MVLLPEDEALSLPARVELVQWRDIGARTGHIVDIDGDGLLKAVVRVGDKQYPKDLSNAQVLVTQTGVTFTRAKRKGPLAERNELPAHWQRLMHMWRVALRHDTDVQLQTHMLNLGHRQGSEDAHAHLQQVPILEQRCGICPSPPRGTDSAAPTAPVDASRGMCLTCPICFQPTHEKCAQDFRLLVERRLGNAERRQDVCLPVALPAAVQIADIFRKDKLPSFFRNT